MSLEHTLKELQDTLIIVSALHSKQAAAQTLHAEQWEATRAMIHEGLAAHNQLMKDLDLRIADLVSRFRS